MTPGSRPGKVITFYSYKGGTGRSMTLANIAWILASNGYQVLAVDWDLEAPGLHRYFHPFLLDPELTDTPGVIDMVWDVAAATMDPQTPDLPDWFTSYSDVLNYAVSLRRKFPGGGTLDLLPAGRQGKLYSTRVGAFDWTNFYDRLGGGAFIESMGASMRAEYDYTLIDSRTGLSDTSGICTVQLPDILVIGFTFNTQSVSGAAAVAESARRQRETLRIYPVPMRVEEGERPKLERGRDFARVRFHDLPTGLTDADRHRYWGEVEIPYRTFYAYEEILAPIGDRPGITNSVVSACERLVAHITEGDVRESVPLDESERRSLLSQLERVSTQSGTDFFISNAPEDHAWAEWLRWHLLDRGYSVLDLSTLKSATASSEAIGRAGKILAVVSPSYIARGYAGDPRMQEQSIPADMSNRLLPVIVAGVSVPALLRSTAQALDLVGVDENTALGRLGKILKGTSRRPAEAPTGPPQPDPPRFPGTLPEVWNVPSREPGFVGRSEVFDLIARKLSGRAVALVGLGGIGKSAIAVEYAHRTAADYDVVWWIDAAQPAEGTDQLIQLGRQLGLRGPTDPEYAVDQVLSALRGRRRWLLIFDDAEDPAALASVVKVDSGHILITSRNNSWRRVADVVNVDVFSRSESSEFLHRHVRHVTSGSATELAEEVGDLPLALRSAAAFIEETSISLEEYLKLFRTHQTELLKRDDPGGPHSVFATVLLALDQLRGESSVAAGLMELLALFGPAPVPLTLLQGGRGPSPDALRAALANPITFAEMIGAITRYSLAIKSEDALQVHRLVQSVVRESLETDDRRSCSVAVEGLLGASAPGDPHEPEHWPAYAGLLPHVAAVETCENARFRQLLVDTGWYLYLRGDAVGCQELARQAAQRFSSFLGEKARETSSALHLAAIAAWDLGEYAEATELNARILAEREADLGRDDPETLNSKSNLALSMAGMGDSWGALKIEEEVLATRERVLGPDHPDTLRSVGNLAVRFLDVGDLEQARAVAEKQVSRSADVLGEMSPMTLSALNNLAVIVGAQGDRVRAAELLRTVVQRRQRVLGPQHPDTLNSTYALAVALINVRGISDPEALSLAQEAAVGFAHIYGESHPSAVKARELASGVATPEDQDYESAMPAPS